MMESEYMTEEVFKQFLKEMHKKWLMTINTSLTFNFIKLKFKAVSFNDHERT